MFSKLKLPVLVLSLSLAVLGCAKEDEPHEQPIQVLLKSEGTCLIQFGSELDRYLAGSMSAVEVASFFSCLTAAAIDFEGITAGDLGRDHYSPQALRNFFQKFFIKEQKIPDSLLSSVMEIKRLFLGGSARFVTRAELIELKSVLGKVEGAALLLRPHVGVLFGQAPAASNLEVRAAHSALLKSGEIFGQLLLTHKQSYTFGQLSNLLDAIVQWNISSRVAPSRGATALLRLKGVLPPAKQILLAGRHDGIAGTEWSRTLESLARSYLIYLELTRSFAGGNLNAALQQDSLEGGAALLVEQIERSVQWHEGQKIPLEKWQTLFQALEDSQSLGRQITAVGLSESLYWFLYRLLSDGQTLVTALDSSHVRILKQKVTDWRTLLQRQTVSTNRASIVQRFQKMLEDSPPMQWDRQFRMVFNSPSPTKWMAADQRQLVVPFLLVDWIQQAFGESQTDHLTIGQFELAIEEVLPLLQNFGWLTDADASIGAPRFREANLFTSASNGDKFLDLSEGVRYLAFITSAFVSAEHWLKVADRLCPAGRPAPCVRELSVNLATDVITPMPHLRQALPKWGAPRLLNYFKNAELAILEAPVQGEYKVGDLLQVWQISEYVEVFMQRFDVDRSQTITLSEAVAAYPLFAPTLKELLGAEDQDDSEFLPFFTFLMKYGESPYTMFGGLVAFEHWKNNRDSWEISVERDKLMAILAGLSKL